LLFGTLLRLLLILILLSTLAILIPASIRLTLLG
jgi:hypothetical protein